MDVSAKKQNHIDNQLLVTSNPTNVRYQQELNLQCERYHKDTYSNSV